MIGVRGNSAGTSGVRLFHWQKLRLDGAKNFLSVHSLDGGILFKQLLSKCHHVLMSSTRDCMSFPIVVPATKDNSTMRLRKNDDEIGEFFWRFFQIRILLQVARRLRTTIKNNVICLIFVGGKSHTELSWSRIGNPGAVSFRLGFRNFMLRFLNDYMW